MKDAGLGRSQFGAIEARGETLLGCLDIAEAEDHRDCWRDGVRGTDILLEESPDWKSNHRVEFLDRAWQEIVLDRVERVLTEGRGGVCLDIVDGHAEPRVKAADDGSDFRRETIDFVVAISRHAKELGPGFLAVPQNPVEPLAAEDRPAEPTQPICARSDGVGVEDLWHDDRTA